MIWRVPCDAAFIYWNIYELNSIDKVPRFGAENHSYEECTTPCHLTWQWYLYPSPTVYPKKYAHGFVVLCIVVVMQSFIMNSHEVFIHIHQGCFAGTGAIVRLPQCQWSKHDGYGKISQCITTTKHSKAKTVCIFLGIYCIPTRLFIHKLLSIKSKQNDTSRV